MKEKAENKPNPKSMFAVKMKEKCIGCYLCYNGECLAGKGEKWCMWKGIRVVKKIIPLLLISFFLTSCAVRVESKKVYRNKTVIKYVYPVSETDVLFMEPVKDLRR